MIPIRDGPLRPSTLRRRLLVLLIPLVTIMVPLFKIVPFLYTWRIRKRLWHWYDELKQLEHAIKESPAEREKHLTELAHIDDAVRGIPIPLQYSEQYYNLRAHIELVERRLMNHPAPTATATA